MIWNNWLIMEFNQKNCAHNALWNSSLGYRMFYIEQVCQRSNYTDPQSIVRSFAKWLATGTTIQRFSTWTKEQFENQFRFWNND